MEKLLYKIIHNHNFIEDEDFLETILKENGIEDIRSFLNVNKLHTHDPFLLKNMKEGIELLHANLNKKIFIKVDPDSDGYTSASYIKQFIKDIAPDTEIAWATNYEKKHGIFYDDIVGIDDISLIIVPDAGSDSIEEAKLIKHYTDIPILILDHHNISPEMYKHSVLINNQDGQYPNPHLSGVGVVHKFCLAYCQTYDINERVCNKYLDLVALGLIADTCDLRDLETRYYVLEGLKEENRHNLLIQEMAEKFQEEMKFGHTIRNYGWQLAPLINGVTRYGKPEEQDDLFRAMSGEFEDREYQPRRKSKDDPKPPTEIHSLQKTMARVAGNVKSRQDTEVRKFMKELDEQIKEQKLDQDSVIIIDGTKILEKGSVSGLVANKLVSEYRRPVIMLRAFKGNPDVFGGSGRGYEKGAIPDFNKFLSDLKLFDKVAGHPSAFGIQIDKDKIQEVRDRCNKLININDLVTIHTVDFEIKANKLTPRAIMSVANAYEIWGNKVEEPTFAITDIYANASDIMAYGENSGFIRFVYNGIAYIKKYCRKDEFDLMTLKDRYTLGKNMKDLKLTIIGNFVLNEYNGTVTPQIKIKYFYSEEVIKKDEDELTLEDIF